MLLKLIKSCSKDPLFSRIFPESNSKNALSKLDIKLKVSTLLFKNFILNFICCGSINNLILEFLHNFAKNLKYLRFNFSNFFLLFVFIDLDGELPIQRFLADTSLAKFKALLKVLINSFSLKFLYFFELYSKIPIELTVFSIS